MEILGDNPFLTQSLDNKSHLLLTTILETMEIVLVLFSGGNVV
jgi:hypothetical protein